MVVRDEILGGLKSALERGNSLEKAMISMFNAGYKRKEIEEAAISLLEKSTTQTPQPAGTIPPNGKIKAPQNILNQVRAKSASELQAQPSYVPVPPEQNPTLIQKPGMQRPFQQQIPMEIQKPVQNVSNYGKKEVKEGSKEKGIVIVLILLLIFLIGLFAAIFFYRQQFIDFLNSLFG